MSGLAIALKPLFVALALVALWLFHKFVHKFVKPMIPNGKIKAFLFQPIDGAAVRRFKPDKDDPNR